MRETFSQSCINSKIANVNELIFLCKFENLQKNKIILYDKTFDIFNFLFFLFILIFVSQDFDIKKLKRIQKRRSLIEINEKNRKIDIAIHVIDANFKIERKRERKNDMNLKIAKENEIIINLKIANEENAIIINFEIKMYIVVVICDTTFDDEIIDDEIETKTIKQIRNER